MQGHAAELKLGEFIGEGAMALTYHKAKPVSLAELGLDEPWLQERILEDPTILGLGDVSIVQREREAGVRGTH